MGVYWTMVCDEAKEFIEPHALDHQGAKQGEIVHPNSRFGALCLYTMMSRWSGMKTRMVPEWDPYDYGGTYKDVSKTAIRDFNLDFRYEKYKIEPDVDYQTPEEEDAAEVIDAVAAEAAGQLLPPGVLPSAVLRQAAKIPNYIDAVLFFEETIPAGATVEVEPDESVLKGPAPHARPSVRAHIDTLGRFKASAVIAKCQSLIVLRIDVEDEEDETKKRNQFAQDTGIPVEVLGANGVGIGVKFDVCYPELISFTVKNKTNEPRLFKAELQGLALIDDARRGR